MIELLTLLIVIVVVSLIYFIIISLIAKGFMLIMDIKNNKIFVAIYLFSLAWTLLIYAINFDKVREILGW